MDEAKASHGRTYADDGLLIACPWHGFEYDVRTGLHPGAADIALTAVAVQIHSGQGSCPLRIAFPAHRPRPSKRRSPRPPRRCRRPGRGGVADRSPRGRSRRGGACLRRSGVKTVDDRRQTLRRQGRPRPTLPRALLGHYDEVVSPNEALTAATEMLRSLRLGPMEFGLWSRRRPEDYHELEPAAPAIPATAAKPKL